MASQRPVRRRGRPRTARVERRSTLRPIIARGASNADSNNGPSIRPNVEVNVSSNLSNDQMFRHNNNTSNGLQTQLEQTGNQNRSERDRNYHNAGERQRKEKINRWISKLGNLLSKNPGERQSKCIVLEKAYNYIAENEKNEEERNRISSVEWIKLYNKISALEHSLVLLLGILKEKSIEVPEEVKSLCVQHLPNFNQSLFTNNKKRICNFLNFFNNKKRKLSTTVSSNDAFQKNIDFEKIQSSSKHSSNDSAYSSLEYTQADNIVTAACIPSSVPNQTSSLSIPINARITLAECKVPIDKSPVTTSNDSEHVSYNYDPARNTGTDKGSSNNENTSSASNSESFKNSCENDNVYSRNFRNDVRDISYDIRNNVVSTSGNTSKNSTEPCRSENVKMNGRNLVKESGNNFENRSSVSVSSSVNLPPIISTYDSTHLKTKLNENSTIPNANGSNSEISAVLSVKNIPLTAYKTNLSEIKSPRLKQNFEIDNLLVMPKPQQQSGIIACQEKTLSTEPVSEINKITSTNNTDNLEKHQDLLNTPSNIASTQSNKNASVGDINIQTTVPSCQLVKYGTNTHVIPIQLLPVNVVASSLNLPDVVSPVSKISTTNNVKATETVFVTQKLQVHSKIASVTSKTIEKPISTCKKRSQHKVIARNRKPSKPNKRWGSVVENVLKNDMFMTSFIIGKTSTVKIRSSISEVDETDKKVQQQDKLAVNKEANKKVSMDNVASTKLRKEQQRNSSNTNHVLALNKSLPASTSENVIQSVMPSSKFIPEVKKRKNTTITESLNQSTDTNITVKLPILPKKANQTDLCKINKMSEESKSFKKVSLSNKTGMLNEVRNKFLEIDKTTVYINTSNTSTISNAQCVSPVISFPKNLASKNHKKNVRTPVSQSRAGAGAKDSVNTSKISSKSFTAEALCKPASTNNVNPPIINSKGNTKKPNHIEISQSNKTHTAKTKTLSKQSLNSQKVAVTTKKIIEPHNLNNSLPSPSISTKLKHQPDLTALPTSLPNILNIFNPSQMSAHPSQIPGTANQIPGNNTQIPGNNGQIGGTNDQSSSMSTGLSNFSAEALLSGTMNMLNTQYQEAHFSDTMILQNTNNLFTNFSADTLVNENPLPYGIDNLIAQNNTGNCWNPHTWPDITAFPEQLFPTNNIHFNQHPNNIPHPPPPHAMVQPPQPHQMQPSHQRINHHQPHVRFQQPFVNIQTNVASQNQSMVNRLHNPTTHNRIVRAAAPSNRRLQVISQKPHQNKQIECSPIKSITSILEPPNNNICQPVLNNITDLSSANTHQGSLVRANQLSNNNYHVMKPPSGSNQKQMPSTDKKQQQANKTVQHKSNKHNSSKSGPSFGSFSLINTS